MNRSVSLGEWKFSNWESNNQREQEKHPKPRAAERIFIGGGGGGKDKKGHYVKKGTYDAHADNITKCVNKASL